jgi:hypothetical protein
VLLVLRMALRSNPFILFTMIRSGWQLFRAGRISLKGERIAEVAELNRALSAAREANGA